MNRRPIVLCLLIVTLLNLNIVSAWSAESYMFLIKWGTSGSGDGQFNNPNGVAADGTGTVYVADTFNHRIQKFNSTGGFITAWGSNGSGDGQFSYPYGVAVDGTGNVYVADTYNRRIQKFSSTGGFITAWGSNGSGDGQFSYPRGVAVDGTGNVYVADTSNHRIQKFSSTGGFITKWGGYGNGDGQFYSPNGVAVDGIGNVYVADTSNHRIQKFSSTGGFITKWGGYGSGDSQFYSPNGVAVDGAGNVYVADTGNKRIQKFTKSATSLSLAVQLACPPSVKVGQPLTATVNLYNWDCYDSLHVSRFMVSVIGNADGTLSGLGIFGPYNRSLGTPKDVPPAVCNTTTTPGTVAPFNLTVMNTVPAALSGKMATVDVEAITDKGQTFGGSECMVNVVP